VISREPLSAQAQPPRRPSGADKKQQPAKKEGRQGRSRNRGGSLSRSTPNSELFAANQHCQTLEEPESSAKTIEGSLPERRSGAVLDEKCGKPQCQKMVRRGDLDQSGTLVAVQTDDIGNTILVSFRSVVEVWVPRATRSVVRKSTASSFGLPKAITAMGNGAMPALIALTDSCDSPPAPREASNQ
jgi:hypothetical protein